MFAAAGALVSRADSAVRHARPALGHVPAWEVAVAVAIMLGARYAPVRLAADAYSSGLLRTGGRPRLRDVWQAVHKH